MTRAQIKHPQIGRSDSGRPPRRRSWGAGIVNGFTSAIALVLKGVFSIVRRILRAIVEALFSDAF
ncbi:MAG: hypothetical protein OXU69_12395 [Gemmatimonadota bacterium]|nr:hypothetical protein [Gemmatimonadota bacterium]MDE2985497.1 hypothetical protein [Gemmatimonadota bacterium]